MEWKQSLWALKSYIHPKGKRCLITKQDLDYTFTKSVPKKKLNDTHTLYHHLFCHGRNETSSVIHSMILYIENSKESTKTVRTNKQVQQVCRIKDKYSKIKCISIH